MRPRNLRIEGFGCFADTVEIDFTAMDVFVISGPTGAGKTTLIDAICYALYGRVPRHAETQQLMSHNRDQMSVALEFEASGARYRVARSINRTRKTARDGRERVTRAASPVQLERFDFNTSDWAPNEDRVREVDAAIERAVGLDFRSFTRCVLLPQGRFAEFLSGDKSERRAVLVELLDIAIYQAIMTAANARATRHANEATSIERRLSEDYIDVTPEALAAMRDEREKIAPDLEYTKKRRDALASGVELSGAVRDARARQKSQEKDRDAALTRVVELQELSKAGAGQLAKLKIDQRANEETLGAIAYDRKLHQDLRAAMTQVDAQAKQQALLNAAKTAAADDGALAKAQAAHALAEQQCLDAAKAIVEAERHLEEVRRANVAADVRSGLKAGDACPVCGGVVGKLAKDGAHDIKPAERAVTKAKSEERAASEAAKKCALAADRESQRLEAAAVAVVRIDSEIEEARAAIRKLLPKGMTADAPEIATAFRAQEDAAVKSDKLTRESERLRKIIADLEPRVNAAAQTIAESKATAAALDAQSAAAGKDADAGKQQLVALAREWRWDDVNDLIAEKRDPRPLLESTRSECHAQADRLTARLAFLESEIVRMEQAIERAATLRTELDAATASAALYRELGTLLRADQFQEFVIEEAMMTLAAAATVHLRTLYERFGIEVAGGEFEVVDHWQADQRRSAKTLSGGETFVASLALALALAERLPELRSAAATSLESLFLDEGFGTLDPETLGTVIDALEGLRSEERMVGIITHVPELAARIETRIDVTKSPAGSTIAVSAGAA